MRAKWNELHNGKKIFTTDKNARVITDMTGQILAVRSFDAPITL